MPQIRNPRDSKVRLAASTDQAPADAARSARVILAQAGTHAIRVFGYAGMTTGRGDRSGAIAGGPVHRAHR
jgi:hypothetical protein